MRRVLQVLTVCLVASSIALSHLYFRPIALDHEQSIPFSVSQGESMKTVASRLRAKGYIGWTQGFVWLSQLDGSDRKLKAGRFVFRSHYRPKDILNSLVNAPPGNDLKLTFPEGLNRWQVADRLSNKGWNRRLILKIIEDKSLEGKLFPDTYRFHPEMSESEILKLMTNRFHEIWIPIIRQHPNRPKLTTEELLILASMVEKETVFANEAASIARVFLNRLKKKMKLQSDPTYVYTSTRYGRKPTRADRLKKNNQYNKDVIKGLPPGPIANTGRNSMLAVMQPNPSKSAGRWLYFVAKRDGTGQHHFSRNYSEHKRAIQRYLKSPSSKSRSK